MSVVKCHGWICEFCRLSVQSGVEHNCFELPEFIPVVDERHAIPSSYDSIVSSCSPDELGKLLIQAVWVKDDQFADFLREKIKRAPGRDCA